MHDPKETVKSSILRAQSELDAALETLAQFDGNKADRVAFAAHELNNYLTVSGGAIELLTLTLENHPDPDVGIWLEGLRHATDLMSHRVRSFLYGPQDEEVKLSLSNIDFTKMVRRASGFYSRIAHRKNINITVISGQSEITIWSDRVAIAAVLDNLLSNAVKYSEPGCEIWVAIESDANSVTCSVRDEGRGLTAAEQERLFVPGSKLGPAPTGGEKSSGYGLAVAKSLVERIGGSIGCESEQGKGTSFYFTLPLRV